MLRLVRKLFLFSFLFLSLLFLLSIGAAAADPPSSYIEVHTGDSVELSLDWDNSSVYYKFVPAIDENYSFYTTDITDLARANLYDENMDLVAFDMPTISDFYIEAELEAGRIYYLQVICGPYDGCTMTVHFETAHSFESSVIKEETCFSPGMAHLVCSYCEYSYDEEIPKAHSYNNSGSCVHCGELFYGEGSFGSGLSWTLHGDVLRISGSGDMPEWGWGNYAPWRVYANHIGKLIIEDGITGIGAFAFSYCHVLRELIIPESVSSIRDYAFYCCSKITDIHLPNSVSYIGKQCFSACSSLNEIHFQSNVPQIHNEAFLELENLRAYYPHGASAWTEDKLQNYGAESLKWAIDHDFGAIEIIREPGENGYGSARRICLSCGYEEVSDIPAGKCGENLNWVLWDGVLTINGSGKVGDLTYFGSTPWHEFPDDITSLVLGEGISSIGDYAFQNMNRIESVSFPQGLESIGKAAFNGCRSLKGVIIPDGVREIGSWGFANSGIESAVLPRSLERIGELAFSNCRLAQLVLPENLLYVGNNAFEAGKFDSLYFMGDTPPMTAEDAFGRFTGTIYTPDSPAWTEDFGDGCTLGHWSFSISGDADCVKGGKQTVRSDDGAVSFERRVLPLSHRYSEMELVLAPTTQTVGKWRQKCLNCGLDKETAIPCFYSVGNSPQYSRNRDSHSYGNYTDTTVSYMSEREDGGFTRIEYINGVIYIEEYDANFIFLSSKALKAEMPRFGGYYSDGNYNFLVFGQNNPNEDDSVEVVRVVRYSRDWYRMDSAGIYGANTTKPFHAGSLQMCSYGDSLYIRTCHEMYRNPSDGKNHQANMSFVIRISDMTVKEESAEKGARQWCYVSHSFNQFILVDDGRLVAVDHGDAYPRSVALFDSNIEKSATFFPELYRQADVLKISGETGDNYTGVNLGGLAASDTSYLVAGCSIEQGGSSGVKNIFVSVTDKNSLSETKTYWFTDYSASSGIAVSNPHIIKVSDSRFCLMWTEGSKLCYVFLDEHGEALGSVLSGSAYLSDCKPIVAGERIVWYVSNGGKPVFYSIAAEDGKLDTSHSFSGKTVEPGCTEAGSVSYTCTDCGYTYSETLEPLGHDTIVESAKAADCTNDGFTEGSHCVRCGEVFAERKRIPAPGHSGEWTILKKASYTESGLKERVCTVCGEREEVILPILMSFDDVPTGAWYSDAVAWAVENEITSGMSKTVFAPGNPCTRAQAVTFLWRAAGRPQSGGSENPFKDVFPGDYYYEAVLWAVEQGITTGLSADSFGPGSTCTRGQIVTFLWRAAGKPAAAAVSVPFEDVAADDYFYEAISWAVEREITSGVSPTAFAPNASCTRAHIVTFLYRAQ